MFYQQEVNSLTQATIDRVTYAHHCDNKTNKYSKLQAFNESRGVTFTNEMKVLKYGADPTFGPFGFQGKINVAFKDQAKALLQKQGLPGDSLKGKHEGDDRSKDITTTCREEGNYSHRDEKNRIKQLLKKKKEGNIDDSERNFRSNNQVDDDKINIKHIKNESDSLPITKKRGGGGFKYPAFINENPLDWLYADNMHLYANNTATKKVITS